MNTLEIEITSCGWYETFHYFVSEAPYAKEFDATNSLLNSDEE